MIQKQVCQNHGPQGLGWITKGETVFTSVYIGKKSLESSQEPLGQKSSIYMKAF
jgi:hypothetical protein